MPLLNPKKSTMTAEEFEITVDEIVKGMTTLHNRLLRIEKWMLTQDAAQKKAKPSLITNAKRK